jgi:hypothetical protein
MRTLIWVILLLFTLLASCAPVTTPVINPSATATKAYTPTSRPTKTITPIPTRTPTPTQIRLAFTGRIIALARADLFELTASADSQQVNYNLIASHVTDAAISPDFRYIVYSTFSVDFSNRLTHLYDLENHTEAVILPDTANSISWSPDSQWVSFISGFGSLEVEYGLYLFDVTSNTSHLVFEPDCAGYGVVNTQGVCGKFTKGVWINSDTLIFQRFTGPLPAKVTTPFYPEVNSNTTTFMSISAGNQVLGDSSRRWFIQDDCGEQDLLREETDEGLRFSIADTADFIANPGTIEPLSIIDYVEGSSEYLPLYGIWSTGLPDGPYLQFIPGSCNLVYLSGEPFDRYLHILNPGTLEDRVLPFPAFGLIAFPSNIPITEDWFDQPDSQVVVMSETTYPTIEIVNLQNAEVSKIWSGEDLANINPNQFRLLAWIVP